MKNLIFDFDGVLGDTWEPTVQAFMQKEGITKDQAIADLMYYFEEPRHSRKHNLSNQEFQRQLEGVKRFSKVMNQLGFDLFHGLISELEQIKGARIAVVSSGGADYVKSKLEVTSLEFSHILTFEDHHSKEEKVEMVCKDWGVDIRQVYYFTDTKTDVIELRKIMDSAKIIGCTWGFHGFEKLREVLPENQILREFGEVRGFL
jgi:FMN phosphatase YigB (HAD superfamily)